MKFDTTKIEALTVRLSAEPFNPALSFELAEEYRAHDQLASAVAFYTRCVEYGDAYSSEHTYASLLRLAECFDTQKNRQWTVSNAILQALAYNHQRPEAWFYMSRYYERQQQWQEAYTYARVGLSILEEYGPGDSLPSTTDYLGEFCLKFQMAVAGWWVGRKDESQRVFEDLLQQGVPAAYEAAIKYNLERI